MEIRIRPADGESYANGVIVGHVVPLGEVAHTIEAMTSPNQVGPDGSVWAEKYRADHLAEEIKDLAGKNARLQIARDGARDELARAMEYVANLRQQVEESDKLMSDQVELIGAIRNAVDSPALVQAFKDWQKDRATLATMFEARSAEAIRSIRQFLGLPAITQAPQ